MQKIKKFMRNNGFTNDNVYDLLWSKDNILVYMKYYGKIQILNKENCTSIVFDSEDNAIIELCKLINPINSLI